LNIRKKEKEAKGEKGGKGDGSLFPKNFIV